MQCDLNTFTGATLAEAFRDATAWIIEHDSDMTVLAVNVDYHTDKGKEYVVLSLFHEAIGARSRAPSGTSRPA